MVEEAGIPTASIYVRAFRHVAEDMTLPRTVITRHPMGRPLGAPGDGARHRDVVAAALGLLESAIAGGTLVELPEAYRSTEPGP